MFVRPQDIVLVVLASLHLARRRHRRVLRRHLGRGGLHSSTPARPRSLVAHGGQRRRRHHRVGRRRRSGRPNRSAQGAVGAELLTIPARIALAYAHSLPDVSWPSRGCLGFVGSPTLTASCSSFAPYLATGRPRSWSASTRGSKPRGRQAFVLGPRARRPRRPGWGITSVFGVDGVLPRRSRRSWSRLVAFRRSPREPVTSRILYAELEDGLRVAYTTRALRYTILVGTTRVVRIRRLLGARAAVLPRRRARRRRVDRVDEHARLASGLVVGRVGAVQATSQDRLGRAVCACLRFAERAGSGRLRGLDRVAVIAAGAAAWGLVIGLAEPLLRTLLQLGCARGTSAGSSARRSTIASAGELVPLAIAPARPPRSACSRR